MLEHRVAPQVLVEERLAENADTLGRLFRTQLQAIPSRRVKQARCAARTRPACSWLGRGCCEAKLGRCCAGAWQGAAECHRHPA